MPTTYTHWRFGDQCIKTLPKPLQDVVNNNRDIFDFGVHGPDIFFYYKCYKQNDVVSYGTKLHQIPFKDTLSNFKISYKKSLNKNSILSYLLGFLAHFTLDSYCHGYIELKSEKQKVGHLKIESQLDRYYLIKDGYDPVKKSVTFSLKPSERIANDIASLFPELGKDVVYEAIKDQKFYLDLLKDDTYLKRFFLTKTFDALKIDRFKDLLITENNDERCKDSNERINKYFKMAVRHYPRLAKNLVNYLDNDKRLLPYFKNNFDRKPDYKKIPILPYKKELKYQVLEFQK